MDVLNRPTVRQKFPQITEALVRETALILQEEAERVKVEMIEAASRDPKDDIFLACAKTVGADYLVSEDNDLLVLNTYSGVSIIDVLRFLTILESRKPEES
jgi:putative PIN family toxin of toxin-antitoxin system